MANFKKGDQVQLKSGGPIMTIQEIGDFSLNDGIEDGAKCIWFDGTKPMERVFDTSTIAIFNEDDYN